MSDVNFENFDSKVPFRVSLSKVFGKEAKPTFVWSIAHATNEKSKAAYKGLCFSNRFTAEEIVSRLYHCTIATWPESEATLLKLFGAKKDE